MNASTIALIVAGVLGAGGVGGLAQTWSSRGVNKADAAATLVGASVQQVVRLAERVAHLEGRLDQIERENDRLEAHRNWWRSRALQVIEICDDHGIDVPPPHVEWEDDPQ